MGGGRGGGRLKNVKSSSPGLVAFLARQVNFLKLACPMAKGLGKSSLH